MDKPPWFEEILKRKNEDRVWSIVLFFGSIIIGFLFATFFPFRIVITQFTDVNMAFTAVVLGVFVFFASGTIASPRFKLSESKKLAFFMTKYAFSIENFRNGGKKDKCVSEAWNLDFLIDEYRKDYSKTLSSGNLHVIKGLKGIKSTLKKIASINEANKLPENIESRILEAADSLNSVNCISESVCTLLENLGASIEANPEKLVSPMIHKIGKFFSKQFVRWGIAFIIFSVIFLFLYIYPTYSIDGSKVATSLVSAAALTTLLIAVLSIKKKIIQI